MDGGGQSSRARATARLRVKADRAFGLTAVRVRQAPPSEAKDTIPRAEDVLLPSVSSRAVASIPVASRHRIPAPTTAAAISLLNDSFTSPIHPTEEKQRLLAAMNADEVSVCTKCRLCKTRTRTVFGEGDVDAKIFFIGEGPGENEDLSGRPFVGKAGQLLDKMIAGMGLSREQVYIANIVKCRPPQNRVPAPDETGTCTPYLQRQLEIIRPRVIVTLGLPSTKFMLQVNSTMGKLRGQWHAWRGIKLMPTFHPAYILRSYTEQTRAAVWSDLKMVMSELGMSPPARREKDAP